MRAVLIIIADIAVIVAGMALIVVAAVFGSPSPAYPHEAPSGWQYPYGCCHDRDCRPVDGPDATHAHGVRVTFSPDGGYRISTTGETLMPGDPRVKPSPDGEFHWCSMGGSNTGRTLCLFVPPLGF